MKNNLIFLRILSTIFFIFLYSFTSSSLAQITNLYGSNKVQADGYTGALFDIKIDRVNNLTAVKVELIPTKKMSRLQIISSNNTKIKAGDFEAKFLGYQSIDGKYNTIECENNWGWNDPKIGERYQYTLMFSGAIPPGLTNFSLIDEGSYSGCRGFGFSNINLNNPDNHPKTYLTEESINKKVDEINDGVVGVYEPYEKSGYKLGCILDGDTYKLIYIGSGISMNWWKVGDVKAILRPSSSKGIFKADWYMSNKTINPDTYITFDGLTMKTIVSGEESGYLKMYPTQPRSNSKSSGTQKSTGTGFAISSSGYIVTNYHVINNARSIDVKGINGILSQKYSAEIAVADEKNDLAIIKINDANFLSIGSIPYSFRKGISDVGESVFVLGYPMTNTMGEEIKLTNGIISSKTGYEGDISAYQVSAPIQPGNSGGPLFDQDGNIIGIINAKHTKADNASYAIKVSYLQSLIELLPQSINLSPNNSLNGKSLIDQVKIASNYTYLVIINDNSTSTKSSNSSATHENYISKDQNAAIHMQEAEALMNKKDYNAALDKITLSIEEASNNSKAYFLRASLYLYGLQNYENAIVDFNKTVQLQPDFNDAYFYRGMSFYNLERKMEAIKDFTKVISLDKDNTDAYFMRALIKSNIDRQGAISDYDEIIKRELNAKPNFYNMATVYNNKAYCLVELDRSKEALPFVNKALELEKNLWYIWDTRGEILFNLGRYNDAILDMNMAIGIEKHENSFYIRGKSKLKLGQKENGCKDLSHAGELGEAKAYEAMKLYCN